MENGPFEDVFPISKWDIPASYVSLPEGMSSSFQFFLLVYKSRAQRNPKEGERQRQLAFMEGFTHLVSAQRRVQRPGRGGNFRRVTWFKKTWIR